MSARGEQVVVFGRTHRVLTGVVVAGGVVIAGIGFAGSYAAVRALAEKKGFGNFSLVFPIGIDAGICVLLALDLLLTWIRIPFPLLRQTAWLLTAATIAFNGAAAWPDPLGVGMHAVIPVLFVVAVEAARHAVGRIADITADKHMEGVRLTRWLLSPVPTFRLWRRMKLWELRSYEQVIKLEQDRLVYQARLQARYGRAWRRKAPVESLMPLRLAKFGVPLADTGPAGLAAAGIEEPLLLPIAQARAPARPAFSPGERVADTETEIVSRERAASSSRQAAAATSAPSGDTRQSAGDAGGRLADAYEAFLAEFRVEPSATQWALWLRDVLGIATGSGEPLSAQQVQLLLHALHHRYTPHTHRRAASDPPQPSNHSWDGLSSARRSAQEHATSPDAADLAADADEGNRITGGGSQPSTEEDTVDVVGRFPEGEGESRQPPSEAAADIGEEKADEPLPQMGSARSVPVGAAAQGARQQRGPRIDAPLDAPPSWPRESRDGGLSASDKYYLEWRQYQEEHGGEPTDEELSAYLAEKGLLGRGGKRISAANLRRHFVRWRIYHVWAEHRARTDDPVLVEVARVCGERGITAQYNKPITPTLVAGERADFERRWQTLTHQPTPDTP
ncbi:DUF2637 domain-containing protein [Streptomyces melanogenes]|uniref:DUF2637 domain-containing protein n=1 Tax=Streptomyces melanogenes TaxID=67326 RepID=UPI001E489AC2|nr:DUF2637 domain-containing protein [Streptomyces melanogenes]